MKHLIIAILFVGIAVFYFGCSDNSSSAPNLNQNDQVTATLDKKPAPNLIGRLVLTFDSNADPEKDEPVWVGTVTFEKLGTFDIRFFHTGGVGVIGQANHFEEKFEIYEKDDVYLAGVDVGVVALANKVPEATMYVMNGVVREAKGDFVDWMDRNMLASGNVYWIMGEKGPEPDTADGLFQIN
ncbi:MAG: hypothetical protein P8X73_12405 [Ignavibacteriaceae bacterium]